VLLWQWCLTINTEWIAVPPSEDRHTLPPKVKGRREGVEDAIKEGTSDVIPKREVALANSLGGTVGIESPSRVG
jgi:hypothetical protein